MRDPLTGAGNRRCFYANVGSWTAASAAHGGLLLLLIDVDHFKRINDVHGHAAGDAVLVEIARRLAALEPARAELLRWGGEEFLLVLREAGRDDARVFARRVLEAVGAAPVTLEGEVLAVHCSIGWTRCLPPGETAASHIDPIVARADQALYRAKQQGRNRAIGAEVDPDTGVLRFL
jgi:diguanylate cyclase (GGDEF)-like protein